MWEAISSIFTSDVFLRNIPNIAVLLIILSVLVKSNIIKIRTDHIQIGNVTNDSKILERTIIREQCDFVHTFLMGLISQIEKEVPELTYKGYYVKYILEVIYDEIIKWITFNHIQDTKEYIAAKQIKLCAIVYSMNIRDEFKTPEFHAKMEGWAKEIILELIRIRKIYTEQNNIRSKYV